MTQRTLYFASWSLTDDEVADHSAAAPLSDIVQVIARYALAIDMKKWQTLAECFLDNAVVSYRGFNDYVGRDAVVAGCRRSAERFVETKHLLGVCDVAWDTSEQTAHVECDMMATHARLEPGGGITRYTIGGRYLDQMVCVAGRWFIAERVLDVRWASGDESAMRW